MMLHEWINVVGIPILIIEQIVGLAAMLYITFKDLRNR